MKTDDIYIAGNTILATHIFRVVFSGVELDIVDCKISVELQVIVD